MSNVLVLGGFTESKRLLEPVADAAVALGFGTDADVLTLRAATAMAPEDLRRRTAGASLITHSAGVLAIPDARARIGDSELPENVIIIAGPEPVPVKQLVEGALWKTADHLFGQTPGTSKPHTRVVRGNIAELIAHPLANKALVPAISRFSTISQLADRALDASGRIGNFTMTNDEFYPNDERFQNERDELRDRGDLMGRLFGGHDELLVDPLHVLHRVGVYLDRPVLDDRG